MTSMGMKFRRGDCLIAALLALLLVGTAVSAQPTAPLSFAEQLFQDGDFYRAVTEYKRFLHLYPRSPQAAHAQLNLGRCYLHAQQWSPAEQALATLLEKYPDSPEASYAGILSAEAFYKQGHFALSHRRLAQPPAHPLPAALQRHHLDLQIWSSLAGENYDQALRLYRQTGQLSRLEENDVLEFQQLPLKSPRLAGTLSAILPGAGQLYAARYKEAGLALLLNAAFLGGGIQAIDTGNHILGGILLFFEAGWYGGNIYNAMNSTHKYNRQLHQTTLERVNRRHGFSLLIDDRATWLQINGTFD